MEREDGAARPKRDGVRIRLAVFGALAAAIVLVALAAPLVAPGDPYAQDLSQALLPPDSTHPAGTDRYGRDLLARIVVGTQVSVLSALALVAIVAIVGTAVGLAAGWRGGWLDTVLMRVSDLFLAFPGLVLALAVAGVLGGGVHNAVLALAAISWPKYARIVRGLALAQKGAGYVPALKLAGCSPARILVCHVLRNIAGPLLVTAVLDLGTMMMELAGLSFLGLGAQPPTAEWGSMISDSRSLLQVAPWTVLAPGLAMFVTVAAFNLFGDALRDWMDPQRAPGRSAAKSARSVRRSDRAVRSDRVRDGRAVRDGQAACGDRAVRGDQTRNDECRLSKHDQERNDEGRLSKCGRACDDGNRPSKYGWAREEGSRPSKYGWSRGRSPRTVGSCARAQSSTDHAANLQGSFRSDKRCGADDCERVPDVRGRLTGNSGRKIQLWQKTPAISARSDQNDLRESEKPQVGVDGISESAKADCHNRYFLLDFEKNGTEKETDGRAITRRGAVALGGGIVAAAAVTIAGVAFALRGGFGRDAGDVLGAGAMGEGGGTGAAAGAAGEAAGAGGFAPASAKTLVYGTTGYGVEMDDEGLDPHHAYSGWSAVRYGVGETLFRFTDAMEPEPWLATGYEFVDETHCAIALRDGVAFSNGRAMDGQAVKECLDRLVAVHGRAANDLKIANIAAEGNEVVIETAEPCPALVNYLCDPYAAIVDVRADAEGSAGADSAGAPDAGADADAGADGNEDAGAGADETTIGNGAATAEGNAGARKGVVCGTGPYRAVSVTDTEISLVRNDGYWGGSPKLDSIVVRSITDGDTLAAALQAGQIDAAYGMPYASYALFADEGRFAIESCETTRTFFCQVNWASPIMQDDAVREALALGIDKQGFVDTLLSGRGVAATGPFPAGMAFGDQEVSAPGYDPERAKQVLEDAGWADADGDGVREKDGRRLTVRWLTYPGRMELPLLAEYAQATLGAIGFDVQVNSTENHTEIRTDRAAWDVYASALVTAPTGDPEYFFGATCLTGAAANYGGYSDPELDALGARLHAAFDPDERAELAISMQQLVLDDRAYVFASHLTMGIVAKADVAGLEPHPCDYYEITADLERA